MAVTNNGIVMARRLDQIKKDHFLNFLNFFKFRWSIRKNTGHTARHFDIFDLEYFLTVNSLKGDSNYC